MVGVYQEPIPEMFCYGNDTKRPKGDWHTTEVFTYFCAANEKQNASFLSGHAKFAYSRGTPNRGESCTAKSSKMDHKTGGLHHRTPFRLLSLADYSVGQNRFCPECLTCIFGCIRRLALFESVLPLPSKRKRFEFYWRISLPVVAHVYVAYFVCCMYGSTIGDWLFASAFIGNRSAAAAVHSHGPTGPWKVQNRWFEWHLMTALPMA